VTVHNFARSLAASNEQADNPIWFEVYTKAFPSLESIACVRQDGWAQRGGIDRVLVLGSGKTLAVDEKVRFKDYGDILLEVFSDYDRRTPGWVGKDLACDYIAYAVIPLKVCYLLPFQTLRRAWQANRIEWVKKYPLTPADNGTYRTFSVGVPKPVLFGALRDAMEVSWEGEA
jgi:hypothetical protein